MLINRYGYSIPTVLEDVNGFSSKIVGSYICINYGVIYCENRQNKGLS